MRFFALPMLLLFVLLALSVEACSAPVLLPDVGCVSGECLSGRNPYLERQSEARRDNPSENVVDAVSDEAVVPEPLLEEGIANEVVGLDEPATERKLSDIALAPEPVLERRTPPPPDRPEPIRCIDKDKDKRCANRIHSTYRVDCDDNDPNVFPGQTRFFPTPNKRGNYDYNCDGRVERRVLPSMDCNIPSVCRRPKAGVIRQVGCGQTTSWVKECQLGGTTVCTPKISHQLKQPCR